MRVAVEMTSESAGWGTSVQDTDVDETSLRTLLADVRSGAVSADEAVSQLRRLPYADLGFARVDHHRQLRQGVAEAVYGPGKSAEQCASIVAELLRGGDGPVLLTRAQPDQVAACLATNPGATTTGTTVVWRPAAPRSERILLITAGTADYPVADECDAVLAAHGFLAQRLTDVGVAGVHRLLEHGATLAEADSVIVVAGMEGALASIVGGLTGAPVIAVPTSVGYGAGLEGVTALLAMLATCAAGVTVVGIDNGFGAASAVVRLFPSQARRQSNDPAARVTR
jgi:pyridinium-3,5-biscarboxylic acid mononucleotide synthase